ncbi:MAG: acyl-CoA dehydrogenase family protein [Deltaproteobacteria bacterium]|nr:acyl-CoA dehydrogenase family protein [Deltaproteobacteria bacterium]
MEIPAYTQDHLKFRKRVYRFMEREVLPNIDQWEAERRVPKTVWKKMGERGFLCTWVDTAYGGQAKDFLYSVIVCEEMARTNHGGLAAYLHSDIVVPYIDAYGSFNQKQKYLPGCVSGDIVTAVAMTEPGAGSDLASMTTSAVENGKAVVLNGSKTFISNGINADLVIVAARDAGVDNPYEAISMYLVEDGTPGFGRGKKMHKMGAHSQDTAELFFSNATIPIENRLGKKGTGFLMLMEKLQQERLITAIIAVAAAEFILDWIMNFCRKGDLPGHTSQAVQFALVEMATEVKLGRTFLDKLIADHMERQNVIIETSMAKYWTTEMVKRLADRALDLAGETAILETCPIVRGFRDVRVMSIFAGTNEIMKGITAKFMGL